VIGPAQGWGKPHRRPTLSGMPVAIRMRPCSVPRSNSLAGSQLHDPRWPAICPWSPLGIGFLRPWTFSAPLLADHLALRIGLDASALLIGLREASISLRDYLAIREGDWLAASYLPMGHFSIHQMLPIGIARAQASDRPSMAARRRPLRFALSGLGNLPHPHASAPRRPLMRHASRRHDGAVAERHGRRPARCPPDALTLLPGGETFGRGPRLTSGHPEAISVRLRAD
jgi:hypothetical protein